MADRELKKLSRLELIDIIYQLRLENAELEQKLSETSARLEDKTIVLENSGSIADAALTLNGVFAAAQSAADQYLLSVQASCSDAKEQIRRARARCEEQLSKAEAEAEKIREDAEREREEKLAAADRECQQKYDGLREQMDKFIEEHPEVCPLFSAEKRQE